MNEQRIERALSGGPPFATAYHPVTIRLEPQVDRASPRRRQLLLLVGVGLLVASLAMGALAIGAFLTARQDSLGQCPRAFDEADAIDTFAPGLTQAQRAWGLAGGTPGRVRPGVIAAYSAEPADAPLSVITIDPETGGRCRLVRFASHHLVQGPGATALDWSPTGDALAIGVSDEDPGGSGSHGQVLIWTPDRLLRVWSVDGTTGVEWAPDGRSLAVWMGWPLTFPDPGLLETRLIHADGSPDGTYPIRPFIDGLDWSPDGSRWVVIQGTLAFDDRPTTVSIVDVDDGRVTPIDLAAGNYTTVGWIDDGRVLIRELTDPGVRYLAVPLAAPADFAIVPLPDEGPNSDLALSPDGGRVAYSTTSGITILDLVTGSASQPMRLDLDVAAGDLPPSWSPDGKRLFFYSGGSRWVVNDDGTGLRQLVTGNVHPIDDPWQPVPVR